jgi:hypothetical protein
MVKGTTEDKMKFAIGVEKLPFLSDEKKDKILELILGITAASKMKKGGKVKAPAKKMMYGSKVKPKTKMMYGSKVKKRK